METVSVGELKARLSEILDKVKRGEEIVISYGKKHTKVAILLPYERHATQKERTLGLLKHRGSCIIHEDFKMSDEAMLLA